MKGKDIIIRQTESNPLVEIRPNENVALIKGHSFVTDPKGFYNALLVWAKDFKPDNNKKFLVEITPGYYNTSNMQIFNLFLKTLEENCPGNIEVIFNLEKADEEDLEETIHSLIYNTSIEAKRNYL